MARKEIGVSLSQDNAAFIEALPGESFTGKMNAFFDEVRAGMWKKGKDLNAEPGTLDHYLVEYTEADLDKITKIKKIQLLDVRIELGRKQLNPTYSKADIDDSLEAAKPRIMESRRKEAIQKGMKVRCHDCGQVFSTYAEDLAALDSLLARFETHIKDLHKRDLLALDESLQFRTLRGAIV